MPKRKEIANEYALRRRRPTTHITKAQARRLAAAENEPTTKKSTISTTTASSSNSSSSRSSSSTGSQSSSSRSSSPVTNKKKPDKTGKTRPITKSTKTGTTTNVTTTDRSSRSRSASASSSYSSSSSSSSSSSTSAGTKKMVPAARSAKLAESSSPRSSYTSSGSETSASNSMHQTPAKGKSVGTKKSEKEEPNTVSIKPLKSSSTSTSEQTSSRRSPTSVATKTTKHATTEPSSYSGSSYSETNASTEHKTGAKSKSISKRSTKEGIIPPSSMKPVSSSSSGSYSGSSSNPSETVSASTDHQTKTISRSTSSSETSRASAVSSSSGSASAISGSKQTSGYSGSTSYTSSESASTDHKQSSTRASSKRSSVSEEGAPSSGRKTALLPTINEQIPKDGDRPSSNKQEQEKKQAKLPLEIDDEPYVPVDEMESKLQLNRVRQARYIDPSQREAICAILTSKELASSELLVMKRGALANLFAKSPPQLLQVVKFMLQLWRRQDKIIDVVQRKNLVDRVRNGDSDELVEFFDSPKIEEEDFFTADPSYSDNEVDRTTLLHEAARWNQPKSARILLEMSNKRDDALVKVIKYADRVDLLTHRNSRGETAFHVAAINGCVEVGRFLVSIPSQRPVVEQRCPGSLMTALHLAASNNQVDFIKMVLQEFHPDLAARCNPPDDVTALHLAVRNGNIESAKLLSKKRFGGGVLNTLCDSSGDLPLHLATQMENLEMVDILCHSMPNDIDLDTFNRLSTGGNALHEAVNSGNCETVRLLCGKYKARTNTKTLLVGGSTEQFTPLHLAILLEHPDIVEALTVEFGADPNLKDTPEANTALHLAVRLQQTETLRLLLKNASAKLESRNALGRTPFLLLAAEHGDPEIAQIFLRDLKPRLLAKSGPNDFNEATALHLSCYHKNFDFARVFLEHLPEGTNLNNVRNGLGENALQFCAAEGVTEGVSFLLDQDGCFEIDGLCTKAGRSALHKAAIGNHGDVAKLLVERGANLKLPSQNLSPKENDASFTPLQMAAERASVRVLFLPIFPPETLLEPQALGTLLLGAAKGGQAEICRFLTKQARLADKLGEFVNSRGFLGRTALHYAALYNRLETARILLENGAELGLESNEFDDSARTALHLASISPFNCQDVIELLVTAGANLEARDFTGNTPLHLACLAGNYQNVKTLIKRGANVRAKGFNGKTPLHYASIWTCVTEAKSKGLLMIEMLSSETKAMEPTSPHDVENCRFVPLAGNAYEDKLICVQLLLYQLAELAQIGDKQGNLPVHLAAKTSNLIVLKYICQEFRSQREAKGQFGCTPFQIAALSRQFDAMHLLLDLGANINGKTSESGKTVLHLMIESNPEDHPELLQRSTDQSSVDYLQMASFLINCGSSLELPDSNGDRPLHTAIKTRNFEVFNLLLSKHGPIKLDCCFTARNHREGATPLHLAFALEGSRFSIKFVEALLAFYIKENGVVGVIDWLLEKIDNRFLFGAETNNAFERGNSSFHVAAFRGNERILRFVIDFLRDKSTNASAESVILPLLIARNQAGRTPLHVASLNGHSACTQLLFHEHCGIFRDSRSRNMIKNDEITFEAMVIADVVDNAFETPLTLANRRLQELITLEDGDDAEPGPTLAEIVQSLEEDGLSVNEEQEQVGDEEIGVEDGQEKARSIKSRTSQTAEKRAPKSGKKVQFKDEAEPPPKLTSEERKAARRLKRKLRKVVDWLIKETGTVIENELEETNKGEDEPVDKAPSAESHNSNRTRQDASS